MKILGFNTETKESYPKTVMVMAPPELIPILDSFVGFCPADNDAIKTSVIGKVIDAYNYAKGSTYAVMARTETNK